ncbi:hypothetical protein ACRAWF_09785 [Streptomyces sp. L7]
MVLHDGLVKVTARLDRDRVCLMDIWIAGDIVGEVAAMGVRTALGHGHRLRRRRRDRRPET